jgi:flagellar basal-body rod protein FlgF/flagellar basal-body rod protein FlgG
MDSGLYAAYTGLLARTQALDTAANNLANAGTTGFRAQRDYFSGVLAGGIDQDPETASQAAHNHPHRFHLRLARRQHLGLHSRRQHDRW